MRLIGHLANESSARTFSDCLEVQGIDHQVEHDAADGWGIWIAEEDKIPEASQLLQRFQEEPKAAQFQGQAAAARTAREQKKQEQAAYEGKVRNRRHLFRPLTGYRFGPLTFALIAISAAVALYSRMGENVDPILSLFIVDPSLALRPGVDALLEQMRTGEVWRLFTPIFIHFGPLHILFNMMWLADLGSMIESRQSTWLLGVFVLVTAVVSNVAQYLVAGPFFGGMSGVVYGLLGYIWIRGKYDPGSGLYLHPTTIITMIIWFVAGYTGLLGHMANTAHAAGLVLGIAWGFLSGLRYR